ncbi:MAG: Gfo/Idh/MocA family oxidoreductase [Bacteroidetes bacterium]|nr:Gfo/Idh/MocA family oxidoreductase [Bacteroidota bacterium]
MESNRRDFIKAFSTMAAAGMFASGMPWLKELSAQENLQNVKIGVIGVGSRGLYQVQQLLMIEGAVITCFCDDYQPHFDRAQQLLGPDARGYKDYREMLSAEQVDAIVIATPLHEHMRMTVDSLDAGNHVFCEKAMAMDYEQCNNMVLAREQNNKILYIGHQRIFNPRTLQAVKEIEEGGIGDVTQIRACWHRNSDWRRPVPSPELERKINWRMYHEYSRGLMTELASHHLQVTNWVLKDRPDYVMGSGSINHWKDGREVYDNVHLVYHYPSDTHVMYDSLISNKKYGMEIQAQGPLGTIEMETGYRYSEQPTPAAGILQLINNIEHKVFDAIPIGGASWVPEDPSEDKGTYLLDRILKTDGSDVQMESFVTDVRNNRIDPWITKQGFDSSIATLMGFEAMMNHKIETWPEGLAI